MSKMTKTDKFLNLLCALYESENHEISDFKLREILGHPSKSQYHKYIHELTQEGQNGGPWLKRIKLEHKIIYRPEKSNLASHKTYQKPNLTLFDESKKISFKAYNQAREWILHSRLPITLIKKDYDYDIYSCSYSDQDEVINTLFQQADNIEVISPDNLKKKFIKKAQDSAFLNMSSNYSKKAA